MKKTALFLILLSTVLMPLVAQDGKFHLTWHGMVNPVAWWDSRQVVSGREGMMFFYPKAVEADADGNDLGGIPSLNMLAITTRLNLTIQGPDIWGARVKGFIEGDFTGSTDATLNCFRLRHAYINMRWTHADVLGGMYWYPMVIHEIMPNTQPLNMGAPFHPYARYAQLRYTHHLGALELMATAAFQTDNKSQGIDGASTAYLKHSSIPELNLQVRYNDLTEGIFFGAAYNLSVIRPRDFAIDILGNEYLTPQTFASHSFSIFGRGDSPSGWSLRVQALLNNNLYEGCTLGGYIEYAKLLDNGRWQYDYSPWHFTTCWIDISRIKGHWRPGIFVGYGCNIDRDKLDKLTADDHAYGRGMDINSLFRIQPHLTYATDMGLSLTAEVEYTQADYAATGKADNLRAILSAVYAF